MTAPTPFLTGQSHIGAFTPQVRPSFRAVFMGELRRLQCSFRGGQTTHGEAIRSALSEAAYEEASEQFEAGAVRRGG